MPLLYRRKALVRLGTVQYNSTKLYWSNVQYGGAMDGTTPLSLVDQVMQTVRGRIAARTLTPGAKLPSIRGFADSLGVSKSTVVEAYERFERRRGDPRPSRLRLLCGRGLAAAQPRADRPAPRPGD
ncbi:GntR family transcriptional regulator [Elstera litoralis]|uniref:GntR family transcriptional regulator n=1 Tax=Elstera litoralis TaxID=552518 RepID=UPI002FC32119